MKHLFEAGQMLSPDEQKSWIALLLDCAIVSAMERVMAYSQSEGLAAAVLNSARRIKVFIVEDELLNAELYRSLLAVLSNRFQTYEFTDGDEAWGGLSKIDPDILITDLLHPGLDGWELLKLLAEKRVTYPILIMSGDCHAEALFRRCYPGLNLHFLGKPFNLQTFHQHVATLLAKSDGLPPMNQPIELS